MNKEKNEIMKERKGLQKKDEEEEEEVKRKGRNCWQETREGKKGRKWKKASIIDDKEWTLRSWRNIEFSLPLSLLCHVGNVRGIKRNNDVKAFLSCVLQPQPYSLSPTANQRLSTPIPDSYVFTPSYLHLFMS